MEYKATLTSAYLNECIACGALVGNKETHDKWHEGISRVPFKPSNRKYVRRR